ncbi:MAG: PspC domain-containing protein [Candidatus Woesearchaeota archaeon]|jgi:phage shock protein PspC (stress-responsive transcriptional regulator)|nr:PspC domain-containing protein [Candidatus Woesearchaeota archaeon]MDP7180071.1 PspC domain-containing protein [Candidatus Woesearchaeota archaeon]
MVKDKKLFRSSDNRMVAGVCAGVGEYFNIDPTVVRVGWVIFTLLSFGVGVLAYIAAWIIIPEK